MKDLQESINQYNLKQAISSLECIKSELIDDSTYIYRTFHANITQSKSLIIHGNRSKRDKFYKSVIEKLEEIGQKSTSDLLTKKIEYIKTAEDMFDEIKHTLPQCAISSLPENIQCWSHIGRALRETKEIMKKVDKQHKKRKNKDPHLLQGRVLIRNDENESFDADNAMNQIIQLLSLTLKMSAFKNDWYNDDLMEIPPPIRVKDEHIFKSGSTQAFAWSWDKLEDISLRGLFFDGQITPIPKSDLPNELSARSLTNALLFDREVSEEEIYDFIAQERFQNKLSQNYIEQSLNTNIANLVVESLNKIKKIDDGLYIFHDEAHAIVAMSEIVNSNIRDDETLYHGVRLVEWIRGYAALKYIANKHKQSYKPLTIERKNIIDLFEKVKITPSRIEQLINHLTFSKNSRDLFDTPLLLRQDGNFSILPHALISLSIIPSLNSRISSLEIKFESKGNNFERNTINYLRSQGFDAKGFTFYIGSDEYEYDAVFIFDRRLFIVECKNTTLSSGNPTQIQRYSKFIKKTTKQINRLVRGLRERPEIILEKFGTAIQDLEIVPVMLNCLPYSRDRLDGVLISDYSALCRFFKSKSIDAKFYEAGREIANQPIINLWKGDKPTSDDLIEYLENPPQVIENLKHIITKGHWHPLSETRWFVSHQINIDYESLNQARKELATA